MRRALEEIGLSYRVRQIGGPGDHPADDASDQPFGQVPLYKDGDPTLFQSCAILIHIGEKDERLLLRDLGARARAVGWLIAALNSIEPQTGQLTAIDVFGGGAEWRMLRRLEVVDIVARCLA